MIESGIARREKFGEILNKLSKKGLAPDVGRLELLKVMRGEGSGVRKVKAEK